MKTILLWALKIAAGVTFGYLFAGPVGALLMLVVAGAAGLVWAVTRRPNVAPNVAQTGTDTTRFQPVDQPLK
jgi:hypothetical protein